MASTCRLVARRNPFDDDLLEADVAAGFRLTEILSADGSYHVEANGVAVEWQSYAIREDDELVTVVGLPGDPASIASSVSYFLYAAGASYTVATAVGAIAGFVAAYGAYIAAAVALISVANFDAPSAQQSGVPERQNSLTGTKNKFAPYAPVPVLYGERRLFPALAAQPFTELVGQDQYLNMLLLVTLGEADVSAPKIGEADTTAYDGVDIVSNYPTAPAWLVVTDTDISIQLDDPDWIGTPNPDHQAATNPDCTAIALDFNFPVGLMYTKTNGGRVFAKIHFTIEYKLTSSGTWINARETSWREDTKGSNVVLDDTTGLPITPGVGAIVASDREIKTSAGTIVSITGSGGSRTITTSTGYTTTSGFKYELQVRWGVGAIEYTQVLATPLTIGAGCTTWSVALRGTRNWGNGDPVKVVSVGNNGFMVTQRFAESFRAGIKWQTPAPGTYDVRVTRTLLEQEAVFAGSDADAAKYQQIMVWSLLHTYTEREAVLLPASIPATFMTIRIKATDQLSGTLDNLSVLAKRKLRYWTGSAWAGPALTRSPAWAFLDMLVNPGVNQRGITEAASAASINLAAIKAWHDGTITTEAFSYDEVIDYPVSVYNGLRRAAGNGWGGVSVLDGKFTVIEDKSSTPVQMFTPRNSWGFQATKSFSDLPHALKVQFDSEDAENRTDQLVVYDDGYNSDGSGGMTAATKFESLRLPGIVNADHAWKMGRRMIALAKLRPETYTWQADVEHLLCQRGDSASLQHDVTLWGLGSGRIIAKAVDSPVSGTTTVTLDEQLLTAPATSYSMRVRRTGSTPPVFDEVAAVPTVTGNYNANWKVTNAQAANWTAGDFVAVGVTGSVTQKVKVLAIRPGADLKATITGADDAAGVYTAHTGTIPAYTPGVTLPTDPSSIVPAKPIIREVRSDSNMAVINPDGSRTMIVSVLYNFGVESDRFATQTSYLRYTIAPTDGQERHWKSVLKNQADGSISVAGLEPGLTYQFGVLIMRGNRLSAWSDTVEYTLNKPAPPQDAFETLTVTGKVGGFECVVGFPTLENISVDYFEVLYTTANNRADGSAKSHIFRPISTLAAANAVTTFIPVASPVTTHFFWSRWVDTFGNASAWYPSSSTAGVSALNIRINNETQGPAVSEDPWFLSATLAPSGGDLSQPWYIDLGSPSIVTLTDGVAGNNCLRNATSSVARVFSSKLMPVDPSKTYVARGQVRQTGGGNYRGDLLVAFYDSSGANITASGSGYTGWASLGTHFGFYAADPWPSTFTKVALTFGALGAAQIPSNAKTMRVGALLHYPSTGSVTGTMDVQDLRVDEVIGTGLLENEAAGAVRRAFGNSPVTLPTPGGTGGGTDVLTITYTTTGGEVSVDASANFSWTGDATSGVWLFLGIKIDDTFYGIEAPQHYAPPVEVDDATYHAFVTVPLAAGSHTFKLRAFWAATSSGRTPAIDITAYEMKVREYKR
ncbi:MAG: hypothetical protein Q8N51_00935 [Gammaproteobacteria bacterium]|nr:hypothetical protein [Gammaproteobacteria bacterium]